MGDKTTFSKFKFQALWLLELIKLNMKSVIAYKTAFFMQVIGMMINNLGFIAVWYVFFQIFDSINGWNFKEMIFLNGMVASVFGFTFTFGYGMRKISRNVTYGQFDRFLVLPKSPLLNIIFSESHISAIGDVFFGISAIIIYFLLTGVNSRELMLLPLLFTLSCLVFSGFIIATQSIVFWMPNTDELSETFFEFMLGPSLYPNSSFTGFVKVFFTFFIPAIVVGGIPVDIIRNFRLQDIILLIIVSVFWLVFSIWIFNKGMKKYESGNQIGKY